MAGTTEPMAGNYSPMAGNSTENDDDNFLDVPFDEEELEHGPSHYPTAPWLGGKKVLSGGQGLNEVYGSGGPQRHFLSHSPNGGTHPVGSSGGCRAKGKDQGQKTGVPQYSTHLCQTLD